MTMRTPTWSVFCVAMLAALAAGLGDANAQEAAPPRPAIYPGAGVTGEQIEAVLRDLQHDDIPAGALLRIEIVKEPSSAELFSSFADIDSLPPGFVIHPLDEPGNPYAGQYGQWDNWEYENFLALCRDFDYDHLSAEEVGALVNRRSDDPRFDGAQGHLVVIRGDGYLIPQATISAARDTGGEGSVYGWGRNIEHGGVTLAFYVQAAFGFLTFGRMPADLWQEMQQALVVARAPHLPAIPQWLADNPPMWLILLPDNVFVTLGPLGSWDDPEALSKSQWFCYDRLGQLIGQTTAGQQWWWEIFWPAFRQTWDELGGMPDVQFDQYGRLIRFFRDSTQETLAYYDYHGDPSSGPAESEPPAACYFNDIFEGRYLPALYAAQQAPGQS